jgi:hypothetical protein
VRATPRPDPATGRTPRLPRAGGRARAALDHRIHARRLRVQSAVAQAVAAQPISGGSLRLSISGSTPSPSLRRCCSRAG